MTVLAKTNIDQHIGPRLKTKRLERGISQEELGKAANITFQQIQKYEKSANRISASTLYTLAKYLGVKIGYFFEGIDENIEYNFDSDDGKFSLSDIEEKYDGSTILHEIEQLIKAYTSVRDTTARKNILNIVESISKQHSDAKATEKSSAA